MYRIIAGLVLSLSLSGACAEETTEVPKMVADSIVANLSAARPGMQFKVVGKAPIPGMYEVEILSERNFLIYASANGSYFFTGDLVKVEAGQFVNLTEARMNGKRAELLAQVDVKDMIVFPADGEPKAHISVFTDVDCGYCRQLHQTVPKLNEMGIEVRYMAYPRAGLGSPSAQKLQTAWCSNDRQDALTRLKNREKLPLQMCDNNSVSSQYKLGGEMGVTGTPAIILDDGELIPGAASPDALAQRLGLQSGN